VPRSRDRGTTVTNSSVVLRVNGRALVREKTLDALRRAGGNDAPVVASANPGCLMHLRGAGLDVRHPAELLAAALDTNGAAP